jgi:hypothetical protein
VLFTVLMLRLRRQRQAATPRRLKLAAANETSALDEPELLPDDPVAALEELRRRARGAAD